MSLRGRVARAAGRAAVQGGALAGQGLVAAGRAAAGAVERRRETHQLGQVPDDVVEAALTALDQHAAGGAAPAGDVPVAVCRPARPRRVTHARESADLRLVPVGDDEPRRPPPAPSSLVNAVLDLVDPTDPAVVVGGLLLRVPPGAGPDWSGPVLAAADLAFAFAEEALLGGASADSATASPGLRDSWEPMALVDASGALLAVQPPAGDGGFTSRNPTHLRRAEARYAASGEVLVRAAAPRLLHPDGTVAVDGTPALWTDGDGLPLGRAQRDAATGLRTLEPAADLDAARRLLLLVAWLMPASPLTAASP